MVPFTSSALSPPTPAPPAAGEGNSALSPLNPGELLIALHNIDSVKCDMKSIIKGEAPVPPNPPDPAALPWYLPLAQTQAVVLATAAWGWQ